MDKFSGHDTQDSNSFIYDAYSICMKFQRCPSIHSLLLLEVPEHFPHTSKDSVPSNSSPTMKHFPGAAEEGAGEKHYVILVSCS